MIIKWAGSPHSLLQCSQSSSSHTSLHTLTHTRTGERHTPRPHTAREGMYVEGVRAELPSSPCGKQLNLTRYKSMQCKHINAERRLQCPVQREQIIVCTGLVVGIQLAYKHKHAHDTHIYTHTPHNKLYKPKYCIYTHMNTHTGTDACL